MQAVIDVARQSTIPTEVKPGTIYMVADGAGGVTIVDTDAWADQPRRPVRCPEFDTAESLLAYLESREWGDNYGAELYASIDDNAITAVLDGGVGWCSDRAVLKLKTSAEWRQWKDISGLLHQQGSFADFLEDHVTQIASPDGATLLEIVQSIQGATHVEWTSAEWLANGQRALSWVEQVEAKAGQKGRLEIPATFTLGLRPYTGSKVYEVKAGLRYRIDKATLLIGFKLLEPERILEAAFNDVVAQVAAGQPVKVLAGRPR